ncbi:MULTISPECIES: alpha/beta fold hydrolase [unclassified Paracoccus (in: a-proteobacteria)]|uniref:alpha/beta fold hydrolase n=1 Tax=unclassified Paracoccus (in: a-proteobacteria) TaxID=2688777 RepID=UPI0013531850|nr:MULTISPECIES: alpha/beta hydrolase [unclassified Paracoccus (in: a-proteobacteria)]UXU74446.1 alpha/beta hydrolase [Paracoccus sp. SMMA_5]UXU80337.1 alpha/beta hydrolase [Paracoccus sp. SMMA_5_TC]
MTPAPFHRLPGDPPARARAFWLRAEDGVRLRAAHWPAEAAQGTVLLFPGRTEYVEKYDELAGQLASAGYHVLAIDWRGQGLSDRLQTNVRPGHVGAFSHYQRDVVELVIAAQELGLPEPWHLFAHSMGGALGLAALDAGLPVRSVVFSAPMWGINLGRVPEWLVLTMTRAAARLGWGGRAAPGSGGEESFVLMDPFLGNLLTGDGRRWGRLVAEAATWPDVSIGGASHDWLREALLECRRLATLASPDLPALIALGLAEGVVSPAAIRDRARRWPTAQLLELPDCRHEPAMERDEIREVFVKATIAHFNASAG